MDVADPVRGRRGVGGRGARPRLVRRAPPRRRRPRRDLERGARARARGGAPAARRAAVARGRGDRRLPVPPARARGRRLGGDRRRGRVPRPGVLVGRPPRDDGRRAREPRPPPRALAGGRLPVARDFARYARESRAQLGVYARFIYAWYDPAFREVFLHPPHGRPGVAWLRREVVSVLAGAITPTWRVLARDRHCCSGSRAGSAARTSARARRVTTAPSARAR